MSEARQDYHLHTLGDGRIEGRCWTNDNLDQGIPNEEADWEVRFADRNQALKATGGTHLGISGVRVRVYIDGVQV